MATFTSLYFGNQQEARLGPLPIPTGSPGQALFLAEPLRFTDMTLTNRTASPITITVWIVPQGATLTNDNILLGAMNLPGNDLITYNNLNIPLNQQDTIYFEASGAGINFFGTMSRRNR